MYITSVLSNLGAWEKFQVEFQAEYQEVTDIISHITPQKTKQSMERLMRNSLLYSIANIYDDMERGFNSLGWEKTRFKYGKKTPKHFVEISAVKKSIGVDITFGKYAFAESDIFVKYPMFINIKELKIAVLILPVRSFATSMSPGVGYFEQVSDRMNEIAPLVPKYPFAIIGISDEPADLSIKELTSPLDNYLIEALGYSLLEMKMQSERPNYDFKVQLPTDQHKIAKEICSLANNKSGGIILVGVDNKGNLVGIPQTELDKTQLRVISIGTTDCRPMPKIECEPFFISPDNNRCILVVKVSEIELKPCMTSERVFIRVGTMARAATSEEIRRLLLGSAA